jgi:hypothetical protein
LYNGIGWSDVPADSAACGYYSSLCCFKLVVFIDIGIGIGISSS